MDTNRFHSRFFLVVAALLGGAACTTAGGNSAGGYQTFDAEKQRSLTPDQAFAQLRAGNERFVAGQRLGRDYGKQIEATSKGQYPFAAVLSCLDSRVPPEILFDQGIGDLFVGRVAGNVLTDDLLGSFEFATKVAGAKLLVVLGHTHCGAVKGACDDVQLGNLTGLLDKLDPVIAQVPDDGTPRNSKNDAFVQKVTDLNVRHAMTQLQERSPLLRDLVTSGQLKIVGGVYQLDTGRVQFFD